MDPKDIKHASASSNLVMVIQEYHLHYLRHPVDLSLDPGNLQGRHLDAPNHHLSWIVR
jgi:hypothetical protein